MTQPTDIRRLLARLDSFRVLDAFSCIGGATKGYRHGIWRDGPYVAAYCKGGGKATVKKIREAKGIDWSTDHLRLREALPLAYTEWIGAAYLTTLAPRLGVAV
ncbi:hypothetical protein ACWGF2_03330 [Streptomyces sp. NPDC054919]